MPYSTTERSFHLGTSLTALAASTSRMPTALFWKIAMDNCFLASTTIIFTWALRTWTATTSVCCTSSSRVPHQRDRVPLFSVCLFLSFSLSHSLDRLTQNFGNMARTRSDEAEIRLRLKDVDKLHPRSWPGSITQGLRAKSLHGCDTLIRSRRLAGEVIQLITSWTSRVTELWTDNRHEKDGTGFGLDYELAVTLSQRHGRCTEGHSNGAESPARAG